MELLKDRERKVLDLLVKREEETLGTFTVKDAAKELGITERTIYNVLYRLRLKQEMARKFINVLLGYRRKSRLVDKVLRRRVTLEEEEMG